MAAIGLTQKQSFAFFKAAHQAAANLNENREEYRKRIMQEEAGKTSIKHLDRTRDFERCMVRMWTDADNYEMAARYMAGDARRLGRLCEICAMQIAQIATMAADQKASIAYVLGVLDQAGIAYAAKDGTWQLDIPESLTQKVLLMLDTHRRRMLRKERVEYPLTFYADASYKRDASGKLRLELRSPPPEAFAVQ